MNGNGANPRCRQRAKVSGSDPAPGVQDGLPRLHILACVARIGPAFQRAVKADLRAGGGDVLLQHDGIDACRQVRPGKDADRMAGRDGAGVGNACG